MVFGFTVCVFLSPMNAERLSWYSLISDRRVEAGLVDTSALGYLYFPGICGMRHAASGPWLTRCPGMLGNLIQSQEH